MGSVAFGGYAKVGATVRYFTVLCYCDLDEMLSLYGIDGDIPCFHAALANVLQLGSIANKRYCSQSKSRWSRAGPSTVLLEPWTAALAMLYLHVANNSLVSCSPLQYQVSTAQ